MTAIATASTASLPVQPGGEAVQELTVRNTGTVVDAFTIEPLGVAAPWTVAEPQVLPLFPGAEGTVRLRFRPPRRSTTPAGEVPWAVRISSREDVQGTWVEEGLLDVAPFSELTAELAPTTSRARGRRRGRHQLAIDNRGNVPTEVRLAGGDEDGRLTVDVSPRVVVLEPGTAQIARVTARAKKGFWKGPAKSHPYLVAVDHRDGEQQRLPATLLQEAAVPGWLVKVLIALLVLALALAALWLTVLKPTIQDAAKAAATDEAAAVAKKEAAAAAQQAVAAAQQPGGAKPSVAPSAPAGTKPPGKSSPPPIDPLGNPVSFRLSTGAGKQDVNKVLSATDIVSITDMFFQNPEGDAGKLELFKDGKLIYTTRLNNWRDLDEHGRAPYEFAPGMELRLKVSCENKPAPGSSGAKACSPAMSFIGYARKPAK